jgi:hypothetical protein
MAVSMSGNQDRHLLWSVSSIETALLVDEYRAHPDGEGRSRSAAIRDRPPNALQVRRKRGPPPAA